MSHDDHHDTALRAYRAVTDTELASELALVDARAERIARMQRWARHRERLLAAALFLAVCGLSFLLYAFTAHGAPRP
jgi:ferric-dicitrate binding protein FerR (iron transport regulator)